MTSCTSRTHVKWNTIKYLMFIHRWDSSVRSLQMWAYFCWVRYKCFTVKGPSTYKNPRFLYFSEEKYWTGRSYNKWGIKEAKYRTTEKPLRIRHPEILLRQFPRWIMGGEGKLCCGLISHDTQTQPSNSDLKPHSKRCWSCRDASVSHHLVVKMLKTRFSKDVPWNQPKMSF